MLNMKKAIAAVGALAMSAGLLAGCGSGSGGSDEGVGTKDSPVELTFWTWQPTDAQTSMAGGEGPDVFGVQAGSTVEQYGRFADDMKELADKYMPGWDSKVAEGAVAQTTNKDGKMVAMPTITSGSVQQDAA